MDNGGGSSKPKRCRVNWNQDGLEKTFLESCIHEGGPNGLSVQGWKNVAETLKKEHGFIVEQRQMKNRYDYIKGKFTVWIKLKNRTGNLYDPISKKFNLTEEEWKVEMKANKHAEPLKNAPLMYPDLCMELFETSAAVGSDGWGPASGLCHPEEIRQDPELNEDFESHHVPDPLDTTLDPGTQTHSKKGKRETMKPDIMAVAQDISNIARMMMEKNKGDDMVACVEKL